MIYETIKSYKIENRNSKVLKYSDENSENHEISPSKLYYNRKKMFKKILYFQTERSFQGKHEGLECAIKGLRCSGVCVE